MPPASPRAIPSDRFAMAALFSVALALRLLNLQQIRAHDPYFTLTSIDETSYHAWARAIAGGDWIGREVFYLGPLYPYLLAPFYAAFGSDPLVPKLLHCFLGAGTCVLVFLLGRTLFDRRVGVIAGGFACVYGMFLFYGGHLLLENVLVPLTVAVVLCAVLALRTPTTARWATTGALVGLATLGRENMLLYAPGILVWMLVALQGRAGVRERLRWAVAFLLAFAAFVAPVSLRNSRLDGGFVLTNYTGGIVFYTAWHPDATGTYSVPRFLPAEKSGTPEEQRDVYARVAAQELGIAAGSLRPSQVSSYWMQRGLEEVSADPKRTLGLLARKLDLLANHAEVWDIRPLELARDFSWVLRLPLLSFGWIAPLGLVGMVVTAKRWRDLVPVYGMIATGLATGLAFTVLARYRLLLVPFLMIFAAAAGAFFVEACRERRFRVVALLFVALVATGVLVNRPIREDDLSMGHFNLANKYVELERWELAVAHFERAAATRPTRISFQNNLALAYERAGRRGDAQATWQQVHRLGVSQRRRDYAERAERHLRELATTPDRTR